MEAPLLSAWELSLYEYEERKWPLKDLPLLEVAREKAFIIFPGKGAGLGAAGGKLRLGGGEGWMQYPSVSHFPVSP